MAPSLPVAAPCPAGPFRALFPAWCPLPVAPSVSGAAQQLSPRGRSGPSPRHVAEIFLCCVRGFGGIPCSICLISCAEEKTLAR